MNNSAGMRSIAIAFPGGLKTNDYWVRNHPEVVENAIDKNNIWASPKDDRQAAQHSAFDIEMAKYLGDPFRGSQERRALLPHENALTLETRCANMALEAGAIPRSDIDLVICTSLFTDIRGVGNATFIAGELGLHCASWNLESACSSALAIFETACALVRSGQYRSVLCVVSCTYSRSFEDHNTMSWLSGDGAGAFVVSAVPADEGLLASSMMHTAETRYAFLLDSMPDPQRNADSVRVRSAKGGAKIVRDQSENYVRKTADEALRKAGLRIADIDWFVVNTPTAWYTAFCARVLGYDVGRSVNTFPRYANCGPALMPVNLYTAAAELPIKCGDLVLLHTVGSMSSAGTAIVRWGDVALGPKPEAAVVTL